MWIHRESGTVYPTAPGTLIGEFNGDEYQFVNAKFGQIIRDFKRFQKVLKGLRDGRPFQDSVDSFACAFDCNRKRSACFGVDGLFEINFEECRGSVVFEPKKHRLFSLL